MAGSWTRRGATDGFGYDPVFFVEAAGCTSAELAPDHKNAISHRALAMLGAGAAPAGET